VLISALSFLWVSDFYTYRVMSAREDGSGLRTHPGAGARGLSASAI